MMSRVTRRIAVWLFSTLSFGLESTLTSPNCSSSFSVTLTLLPTDKKPSVSGPVAKVGLNAENVPCDAVTPDCPVARKRSQVMPRWYSLRSCTSATVASISTWRFAPTKTWSRNSCTRSCCLAVART